MLSFVTMSRITVSRQRNMYNTTQYTMLRKVVLVTIPLVARLTSIPMLLKAGGCVANRSSHVSITSSSVWSMTMDRLRADYPGNPKGIYRR